MKTNTITPRTETILRMADSLQAVDGSMIQTQAFYDFLRFQRDVQKQIAETWTKLEAFMRANDIPTVKGDWGHATLSDGKTTFAATDMSALDPIFTKPTLDTAKIKGHIELFGALPAGVIEKMGKPYLSKEVSKKW